VLSFVTSAVNTTLPTFAAKRMLQRLLRRAMQQLTDTNRCSSANKLHAAAAVDRWDRETDA